MDPLADTLWTSAPPTFVLFTLIKLVCPLSLHPVPPPLRSLHLLTLPVARSFHRAARQLAS